MKHVEHRRIVPAARLAAVLFGLMALFQVFVIAGGYELKAPTVKKIAPKAYEPFLKLVGEHPETRPEWAATEQAKKERETEAVTFAGFDPTTIDVTLDVEPMPEETVLIEPTKPVEQPKTNTAEVVPVG